MGFCLVTGARDGGRCSGLGAQNCIIWGQGGVENNNFILGLLDFEGAHLVGPEEPWHAGEGASAIVGGGESHEATQKGGC